MKCRWFVVLLSFSLLSALSSPMSAVTREWDDEGATSDWSDAANWTDDGVPGNMDSAIIGSLPAAFDDMVVLDINADVVRDLSLESGADLDLDGGRLVMNVDASVGAGAAAGTTISELLVRKRNAVGNAAFAVDANSLVIGSNGRLNLIDGGQIELDGTGLLPGTLTVADGGEVLGHGLIELSDSDASLGALTSLIDNSGAIVVRDPLHPGTGEPMAVQMQLSSSNAPMFAQYDFGGTSGTGTIDLGRNAQITVDRTFLGPNTLTMAANSALAMDAAGSIADGQTIEVNSGAINVGTDDELPADAAVISGTGLLTVSASGAINLDQVDEELFIETEFDGVAGEISNRGIVRFRGGGNIREIALNALDDGAIVNESSAALKFQGGQTYDTPLLNAGLMSIVEFGGGDASVELNALQQTDAGTLALDIGGELAGEFDVLTTVDDIVLDGTLEVTLTQMFEPALGDTFTILISQNSTITGQFATTDLPEFNGLTFDVIYNAASVELQVVELGLGLPGDFDADGDVDGTDFLVWQRGGSPNPLSAGDLETWQTNYGGGDIPEVAAVAVPEPTTLAATLLAVALGSMTHRRN